MSAPELTAVGAGFTDDVMGSQSVFRSALKAWSYPARWVDLRHDAESPEGCSPAASALLLALLDSDCTLWISKSLRPTNAYSWLQFHTGCQIATNAEDADFIWLGAVDQDELFVGLRAGTDSEPQNGCTLVIESHLQGTPLRVLASGPGIKTPLPVEIYGLTNGLYEQRQAMRSQFPRGFDIYLCNEKSIMGLPRTTVLSNMAARDAVKEF